MQSQTIKSDPLETVRSDADERGATGSNGANGRVYRTQHGYTIIGGGGSGQTLSPLARAALANGVSFDDVLAYSAQRRVTDPELHAAWYEMLLELPEQPAADVSAVIAQYREDAALDGALARSVLARGTISHARLWWHGCLDVRA